MDIAAIGRYLVTTLPTIRAHLMASTYPPSLVASYGFRAIRLIDIDVIDHKPLQFCQSQQLVCLLHQVVAHRIWLVTGRVRHVQH